MLEIQEKYEYERSKLRAKIESLDEMSDGGRRKRIYKRRYRREIRRRRRERNAAIQELEASSEAKLNELRLGLGAKREEKDFSAEMVNAGVEDQLTQCLEDIAAYLADPSQKLPEKYKEPSFYIYALKDVFYRMDALGIEHLALEEVPGYDELVVLIDEYCSGSDCESDISEEPKNAGSGSGSSS